MKHLKKFNESIETSQNLIDLDKLKKYANAIDVICNEEYGITYYNEKENHVYVCLGDSNPFNINDFDHYIKNAICIVHPGRYIPDYKDTDKIKVTVEYENEPDNENDDWLMWDGNDFIKFTN